MEKVLEVRGLTRRYPSFLLDHVSFSVEKGKITGFIGRNGAGKSTTLGTLFGFVHPDEGEIWFMGENIKECERQMKQQIGYVAGGIDYYPKKKNPGHYENYQGVLRKLERRGLQEIFVTF